MTQQRAATVLADWRAARTEAKATGAGAAQEEAAAAAGATAALSAAKAAAAADVAAWRRK